MLITYRNHPLFAPEGEAGAAGSEGAGAQSQEAGKTADASGTNGGQQASGGDGKTFTQADLDELIAKRLDRAKKTWDDEAKQKAEADAKKKADAQLPELERLRKEHEEATGKLTALQLQIRERDAKDSVSDAAKKAGATDASPIWRMLKSDLEYDDSGAIKNLDALIKDAKAIAPQLFRPQNGRADAGSGSGSRRPTDDINSLIRRAAGRE